MHTTTRRRRALATAVVLAAATALPTSAAGAAEPAGTASITGVVVDSVTGEPVEGASVHTLQEFEDGSSSSSNWVRTDADGRYVINELSPRDRYAIVADSVRDYFGVSVHDPSVKDTTTHISPPMSLFTPPAVVDITLTRGVQLSGTMRRADGTPDSGGEVTISKAPSGDDGTEDEDSDDDSDEAGYDEDDGDTDAYDDEDLYDEGLYDEGDGSPFGRSVSFPVEEDGTWSRLVAPGDYLVSFTSSRTYNEWFAPGTRSAAEATVYHATIGQPLVIDGREPSPTVVTGTVTDASTGAPVQGVCVSLADVDDLDTQWGESCSTSAGTYRLNISGYEDEISEDARVLVASDERKRFAASTTPAAGINRSATTTINVPVTPLSAFGTLTGTVVDRASGKPLADICPWAYPPDSDDAFFGQVQTCSDSSGTWTLHGLPAGPARVRLSSDFPYVDRWVGDAGTPGTPTTYTVVMKETTSTTAVPLDRGGTLTGVITDRQGKPVEGAWVVVGGFHSRAGAGEGQYGTDSTDAQGRYTIKNIPVDRGVVLVYGDHDSSYAWQWNGSANDPARATPLQIPFGSTTKYDAVVGPEARLEVTLENGPRGYTMIDAYTASGAAVGWSADIRGDGTATIRGLPASEDIRLRITPPNQDDDEGPQLWYGGASSLAEATPITVRAGETTRVTVRLP